METRRRCVLPGGSIRRWAMAYSDFTLAKGRDSFGLTLDETEDLSDGAGLDVYCQTDKIVWRKLSYFSPVCTFHSPA